MKISQLPRFHIVAIYATGSDTSIDNETLTEMVCARTLGEATEFAAIVHADALSVTVEPHNNGYAPGICRAL